MRLMVLFGIKSSLIPVRMDLRTFRKSMPTLKIKFLLKVSTAIVKIVGLFCRKM